jgi:DNA-directed RNA polymerase beta subunit
MFRTLHFRSYKAQTQNKEVTRRLKNREKIDFGKTQSKKGLVDSLDVDGLPYVGANLRSGDIVIGKVSESGEDHSVKLMHTEKGHVEKVVLSANDDGNNYAVVTLRQVNSIIFNKAFYYHDPYLHAVALVLQYSSACHSI